MIREAVDANVSTQHAKCAIGSLIAYIYPAMILKAEGACNFIGFRGGIGRFKLKNSRSDPR